MRETSYHTKDQRMKLEAKYSFEISPECLQQQFQVKELTKNFVRVLKNPDLQLNSEKVVKTRNQQGQIIQREAEVIKPSFELINSSNIMMVSGAPSDTRVLVESFLQANMKMRSKYKCAVMHCCHPENKLSQDPYCIFKNIIFQLVRSVPAIRLYLMLQSHNYFKEMLTPREKLVEQNQSIQWETPDLFVKFCKKLSYLKLDFNIGIVITGVETLFNQHDLQSFFYVFRSAMVWCPPYFRFLFTAEIQPSKAS